MHKQLLCFTLLSLLGVAVLQTITPVKFPLYMQCDAQWGSNLMESSTICQEGCAMSCVSMALAGYNISIDGQTSNPEVLNNWLRNNAGYVCEGGDCNNLVIASPDRISPDNITTIGEAQKPTAPVIQQMISQGYVVIAHVHNNHHFVLINGYESGDMDNFNVNDPFYPYTSYPYANITDCIIYRISK